MRDSNGRRVPLKDRAETIATYLSSQHWSNDVGQGELLFQDKIGAPLVCDSSLFTLVELELVLKSSKLNKQPGPDLIRMELFKWLDGSNRLLLLDILNQWWKEGGVPKEVLHARVVPIFKKGDIDDPSNYRPISLLNSIYKLFTALVRARIQSAVEFKVSPTQFGFRPRRSTAHAAFIIRRLQDWSEQKNSELYLALIDWEKAFDKVHHSKLLLAMDRLGFSEHFLRVISSLYDSPTFFVQDQYGTSLTKSQLTGIRQGCPLSPYLFLLVMTCVDHDVQRLCSKNVTNSRIPGVEFDAVFYADDTILFSTKPRALNELLKHMENCSERYGLKINRRKCHTLHMQREASIHFQDNAVLHKAHDATYLGNNLNCKVNLAREGTQRIQDTKRTWQKLNLYWKNSSTGKKWQLIIYDAVIRSKLLYNLETMCLTQSLRKKLDTFHLRGLRKILQVPTTYVDRRYTNARVYELASQIAYPDDPYKSVRPFSAILDEKRTHLAGHILRAANSDPLRQVVYEPNTATVKRIGKRRVGRPRINWAYNTNELIHSRGNATDYVASIDQDNNILEFAKQRFI